MSALEMAEWFKKGREAYAAGHKCYGRESMEAPKPRLRTEWRRGWRAARREKLYAEQAA